MYQERTGLFSYLLTTNYTDTAFLGATTDPRFLGCEQRTLLLMVRQTAYYIHTCIWSLSPLFTGHWETDEDMSTQAPKPYTLYNRQPGTCSVIQEKMVYIPFYSVS